MNEKENNVAPVTEENSYSTGIKPPKKRGNLTLVLVGMLIFFGGIITALGPVNIRLLGWTEARDGESASLAFYGDGDEISTQPQIAGSPVETAPQE